ncbi:MAG: hypothetical protein ACRDGU_02150 [Actinomycetota bacterium]
MQAAGRGDVERVAQRLMVPRFWNLHGTSDLPISAVYGDFSPPNIRLKGDALYLLDLPAGPIQFGPVYRDIAAFIVYLQNLVETKTGGHRPFNELRQCFYQGYAKTGIVDIRTSEHRELLALYVRHRRVGTLVNLWKRGRRGAALRLGVRWASHMVTRRNPASDSTDMEPS